MTKVLISPLQIEDDSVPMAYLYWTKDFSLKKRLLENQIYIATYWYNVKEWCKIDSLEVQLTKELIHLPIEQRYNIENILKVLKLIL